MAKDNHYGPRFEDIKKTFPDSVRYHYHVDAFNPNRTCWMVATKVPCGDGIHTFTLWKDVYLCDLQIQ